MDVRTRAERAARQVSECGPQRVADQPRGRSGSRRSIRQSRRAISGARCRSTIGQSTNGTRRTSVTSSRRWPRIAASPAAPPPVTCRGARRRTRTGHGRPSAATGPAMRPMPVAGRDGEDGGSNSAARPREDKRMNCSSPGSMLSTVSRVDRSTMADVRTHVDHRHVRAGTRPRSAQPTDQLVPREPRRSVHCDDLPGDGQAGQVVIADAHPPGTDRVGGPPVVHLGPPLRRAHAPGREACHGVDFQLHSPPAPTPGYNGLRPRRLVDRASVIENGEITLEGAATATRPSSS